MKGFLQPTLLTCAKALKPGGYALFNVDTEREGSVKKAAAAAGFKLVQTTSLELKADPFSRKAGKTESREEPVLVFTL